MKKEMKEKLEDFKKKTATMKYDRAMKEAREEYNHSHVKMPGMDTTGSLTRPKETITKR